MEAKLYIPTDLSEITLEQYQYLMKITNVKDEEEISARKMISVLCKIPLSAVLKLEVSSVLDITSKFSKMFEKYDQQLIHRFKLAGTEFGFITHLESMSWGEYMDAEKYMSDWQSMHNAMAVLFRPIVKAKGEKYSIEEYESSINYAEVMKGMPLNVAISANIFFLDFRGGITRRYDELFSGADEGDESGREGDYSERAQFGQRWGWYSSIYAAAKGDVTKFDEVTKLSLHQALTFLTFEKEKNTIEVNEIRRRSKI